MAIEERPETDMLRIAGAIVQKGTVKELSLNNLDDVAELQATVEETTDSIIRSWRSILDVWGYRNFTEVSYEILRGHRESMLERDVVLLDLSPKEREVAVQLKDKISGFVLDRMKDQGLIVEESDVSYLTLHEAIALRVFEMPEGAVYEAMIEAVYIPPVTAKNLEVCAMSLAHVWHRAGLLDHELFLQMHDGRHSLGDCDVCNRTQAGRFALCIAVSDKELRLKWAKLSDTQKAMRGSNHRIYSLHSPLWVSYGIEEAPKAIDLTETQVFCDEWIRFFRHWRDSSYAKLEVSHKLAASFCLTDVPEEVEVHAPWTGWSLVVPPGLLGSLSRVWCVGVEPMAYINVDGTFFVPDEPTSALVNSLVKSSCLALSDPERFRKQTAKAESKGKKRQRTGVPIEGSRYLLSAPVKVDLREEVERLRTGRKLSAGGNSPKVQFLVRGHWRQQAYGPHHSLRKPLWIDPFWKGPEEARILLRSHVVADERKVG